MLILHLVPVGRSLLIHLDQGTSPTLRSALAVDELPVDTVGEALRQATGQDHELDLQRLRLTGVPAAALALDTGTAAEWTSVAAAQPRSGVVDGEAYLFIATDTDDGLRAAVLLAARYQHPLRYLHEPLTAGDPEIEPGDVYLCRIPDLDLGSREPTGTTWRSLGTVGRLAAKTAAQTGRGDWQVIVHLSGGYKAMIPYLMVLAEGINSIFQDLHTRYPATSYRPTIKAVAVHESSLDRVVPIPVRFIQDPLLAGARKLAELTRPDSDIIRTDAADQLLGLFIERKGEGTRRLTEAGLIMVSLL
ncbi:MAG: hypothetical protein ACRDS1_17215 [Pseudonocardiaceae bacterium]